MENYDMDTPFGYSGEEWTDEELAEHGYQLTEAPFDDMTRAIPCDVCGEEIGKAGQYGLEDTGNGESGPRLSVYAARCPKHLVAS
jgi:hypothetical protein